MVERAQGRCEYCLLGQADAALFDHEVDHIIAELHRGSSDLDNLAYACFDDNRRKGSNIASTDLQTGDIVALFHPRQHRWSDHFELDGAVIIPKTSTGRATVALLRPNDEARLRRRAGLARLGRYP